MNTPLLFFQNDASGHEDPALTRSTIETCLDTAAQSHDVRDSPGRIDFFRKDPQQPIVDAMNAAARMARERQATLVVIGGDGSVNVAAAAALEHELNLGIIPGGTFNFVARAHAIPEDTSAAVRLLLSEPARETRAALLNEHVFMVNASIGLYAKLLSEREAFKRQIGRHRIVAVLAAASTALRRHRPVELCLERHGRYRKLPASTFIVGNNRLQLELIGVRDLPPIEERTLTAAILHPVSRLGLLGMIVNTWRGVIHETPELETFNVDRLQVDVPRRRRRRITTAIDGEVLRMDLPLTFSVHERPLMLVRPASAVESNGQAASGQDST